MKKRIYFGPSNINYFSQNMAKEFNLRGYNTYWQLFNYDIGQDDLSTYLSFDRIPKERYIYKWVKLLQNFTFQINKFDIFHFTGFQSFLPKNIDIPILKRFGKKICMNYMGSELRVDKSDQVFMQQISVLGGNSDKEKSIYRSKRYIKFSKWIDAQIIMDPSLFPSKKLYPDYFSKVEKFYYLPPAINVNDYQINPNTVQGKIIIAHIPSKGKFKGTEYITPVFEKLEKNFSIVKTILLTNLQHKKLIEQFYKANIVVEQLLANMYGNTAREAMALGKVVVGRNIREPHEETRKLYPFYDTPTPPIIHALPETLYEVLVKIIKNPGEFNELGFQNRKFVENYHNVPIVADRLETIYQDICK